jgi:pyruvyltransferase
VTRWIGGSRLPASCVPMYWFRGESNFGDALAPAVVGRFTGLDPRWVSRNFRGKCISTGSILDSMRSGDVVIGAGLIEPRFIRCPPGTSVVMTRGPLTAECLIGASTEVLYGDPALALPLLVEGEVARHERVGIVPHIHDQIDRVALRRRGMQVIDVTAPWREVVDAIRSCRAVVSSSLHGIIVAEAFGVPALWARSSQPLRGGDFKFHDYYCSTARDSQEALHLEEALSWAAGHDLTPAVVDSAPVLRAFELAGESLRSLTLPNWAIGSWRRADG